MIPLFTSILNQSSPVQSTQVSSTNNDNVNQTESQETIESNEDKINIISLFPTDFPLNSTGELIDFKNFQHALSHLSQFMDEASEFTTIAMIPNSDLSKFESLIKYVEVVSTRIIEEVPNTETWKLFLIDLRNANDKLFKTVLETQSNANMMFKLKSTSTWSNALSNASINSGIPKCSSSGGFISPAASMNDGNENVTQASKSISSNSKEDNKKKPNHKSSEPSNDPDDSDSSSSSSSDESDDSSYNKHQYTKGEKKKKKKRKDKRYRELVKNLMKSAKNFGIRSFNIHPDPTIRRERFRIWISDMCNILSTDQQTYSILVAYPAKLELLTDVIDRALKTVLFTVTQGQAKQLISAADTAYQGLIDLG
jgi:hypothetical protein